jgi:hypothetical protein
MPVLQFAVQSYKSKSLPVSAQRCVNCYPEKEPTDAKTPVALFGAPGLATFANVGSGPIRNIHLMNNVLYIVSGNYLYSLTSAGVVTTLGGQIPGSGFTPMADNGTQVCIVNGTSGYIYSALNGFQIISDPNFHSANSVTFFDNFFAFDWANTNKWFISNSQDGTTYTGTDFASAEVSSDFVLSLLNQQENMLIFGQRTIETWYDAGAVNFPFQRVTGATIERGCAAALTPVKEDSSVFFLGDDLIFYRLDGTALVRQSTHAIEAQWQTYQSVSDAYCFSYTFEGHKFVIVVFPTANATWILDLSTGLWHERESWDQNNNSYGRWRGTCAIEAFGKILIGDLYSNNVGFLTSDAYTEFGNTVHMFATAPPLHNDRQRIFVSVLEMDVESGVGLATGQGSAPIIYMDYSKDGGRTFNNLQRFNSLGPIGAYLTRVRWLRLGQSRQWVFRVHISDPVKRVIVRAHAQMSLGQP